MKKYTIGIVRESKIPPDKRVPFTPTLCLELMQRYSQLSFIIQPSDIRIIPNKEYSKAGITIQEDLSHCDAIFGVKEIQPHLLIPEKTYFFFSHTIKKQPHNRYLLQTILEKNIRLVDYECIRDLQGNRLVAFGYYAGLVGAYNTLLMYGLRTGTYTLKRAYTCDSFQELKQELQKIKLSGEKIIVTGTGRVAKGIDELLQLAGIHKVSSIEFIDNKYDKPVYTCLSSADYHVHKDNKAFDRTEFHAHPERYLSTFIQYAREAEILIAGAYWNPNAPLLFNKADMKRPDFKIKMIGDITCDINGSIPSTIKASTILEPFYDYNPHTGLLEPAFSDPDNITTIAVDNLPGEIPAMASQGFGEMLQEHVIPTLLGISDQQIIDMATIASAGALTDEFMYLNDYVHEG